MPRKTVFSRSVPWWTAHLTSLKKRCNRMRRRLQRLRDPDARDNLRRRYAQLRRLYSRSVYRAKTSSWRTFVTELGNQDPYGIVYKIIRRRLAVVEVMADFRYQGGHTLTWGASASFLLQALIPDAPPSQNRHLLPSRSAHLTRRWTYHEVLSFVRALPSRKAPGSDLIESAMLKQLVSSPTFIRCLVILYNGCLVFGCFPTIWKRGLIRALLKDITKDPSDTKSYRPICLLPFLGKLLEVFWDS